jgi:hypothetical protein
MEITQTNINQFYKFVQDQISKITTSKGLHIDLAKNIMTDLDYLTPSEIYHSKQCDVSYDLNSLELKMWF